MRVDLGGTEGEKRRYTLKEGGAARSEQCNPTCLVPFSLTGWLASELAVG